MKLKRILAAALCLLVVAAILPTAAFAAGTRNFTIAFKTADVSGAGTDGYVWVEIWYDDEGKDVYRRDKYLDNKGDDFERNHTDYYTFAIPNRPVRHVKIIYEDCGWMLEYVEFDGERFDKFERAEDGFLYDGSFVLDVGTGKIPDARIFTIGFKTADKANAGTDGSVWVEIWYDDEGNDIYRRKDNLDNPGNDFERNQMDYYTFDIPNRPIRHVKIEYKDCGWLLEYVEFDGERFDQFERSEDGFLYDGSFVLDVGTGKKLDTRTFSIAFKTSDIKESGTDADVWAEIWYDDEGKDVFKSPLLDNEGNDFERGEKDYYTFEIPNRPVRHVKIEYKASGVMTLSGSDWMLDFVEIDGVKYFRPEGEWLTCDDSFMIDITEGGYWPEDISVFTFSTGNWEQGGTDATITLTLYYKDPETGEITTIPHETGSWYGLFDTRFEKYKTDDVVIRNLPTDKELVYIKVEVNDGWDFEWLRINDGEIIPMHFTFMGAVDECWVFPGVEVVDKPLGLYVGQGRTADKVYAKFSFEDGTETGYYLLPTLDKEFTQYDTVIRIPDKPVTSITIRKYAKTDPWYLGYMNFDGSHYNTNHLFETVYAEKYIEQPFYPVGSEPSDESVSGDGNNDFPEPQLMAKALNLCVGEDGTENEVYAKFGYEDGTETDYYKLTGSGLNESMQYYFELKVPDKQVQSITIKTTTDDDFDSWRLEYMNIDGTLFNAYYTFTQDNPEHTFYPGGSEPSNAGSVFGDANMGIIIGVGAAVIVIAAAAVIVGVRKKKKSAGSAE